MASIGSKPPGRNVSHQSSSPGDFSGVRAAYENAIDNPKERHAEVGILLPNGENIFDRLGKNEAYGSHRVGSVTKTFTVFLALKLIKKERFLPQGLDTRCGDILPDDVLSQVFEDLEAAQNMTLEQLLSHTSGLEHDDHCSTEEVDIPLSTLDERFRQEGRKYIHTSQPGDKIGYYSNAGLAVAGWMMEVAYNKDREDEIPFSQIMKKEIFEEVFDLSESFIAPGPSGDIIQSPAGDMTSSVDDLMKVAIRLQEGEASLESFFGPSWQSTMLKPRDLFQHHGLGCIANASSIQHGGLNMEKFDGEPRDVTALVIFPLGPGETGLVAMCDSNALGPGQEEFISKLKEGAKISSEEHVEQGPIYDMDFFCPNPEDAFIFHGDAYLITHVDPFVGNPDTIICSRNGMKHALDRDLSGDEGGIRRYLDENGKQWLVISSEDGRSVIYSDYCLVTKKSESENIALVQSDLATVQSLQGTYQNTEDLDVNPTYNFIEKKGHLFLKEGNDAKEYPCLYISDEKGGTWVSSDPNGRKIRFRFPENPDENYLEITDILTGLPQPPYQTIRKS